MKSRIILPWMIGPPVMRRLVRNYLVGSSLVVAAAIGWVVVRKPLGVHREWWARFPPLALGVLPMLVFMPMTWWLNRRMRRDFHDAGGRLCTHCAYNVGPLGDAGICPECGERFDAAIDAATWKKIGYNAPEVNRMR